MESAASGESVTWVITHNVRPDQRRGFEEWLSGIAADAAQYEGSEGLTVLRPSQPTDTEYVVIARFATYEDLRRWEESPERADWLARLEPLVTEAPRYRSESGLETWFQLPGHQVVVPPPKRKMAVLVLLAIYPLILIVVPLLGALLGSNAYLAVPVSLTLEFFVRTLITAVILVVLMTWFAMPQLTRLFRGWLYPR
ncbi:MAG: antibiotic biosynthesis monooxygenase [Acidimicrobiia bacterium]